MPFLLSGKSWHIILPVKQHYSLSCLSEHSHILIKKKKQSKQLRKSSSVFFVFFLCGETRSRQFAGSRRFSSLELTGASNHGCVFPSVCASCVCVCAHVCVCLELLLLLLLLLPLASISSRLWPNQQNSLSCPFGSPARVPIILWSNINVWYWACSLIQSQLILSVNYLQILRCGGRSPRTISARFRIRNWLPLSSPPPHPGLTSFFFSSPPLVFSFFFFPLFISSFLFCLCVSFKA